MQNASLEQNATAESGSGSLSRLELALFASVAADHYLGIFLAFSRRMVPFFCLPQGKSCSYQHWHAGCIRAVSEENLPAQAD